MPVSHLETQNLSLQGQNSSFSNPSRKIAVTLFFNIKSRQWLQKKQP